MTPLLCTIAAAIAGLVIGEARGYQRGYRAGAKAEGRIAADWLRRLIALQNHTVAALFCVRRELEQERGRTKSREPSRN